MLEVLVLHYHKKKRTSYKSLINFNKCFYSLEILMGKANGYFKEIGFKIIFRNFYEKMKN